MGVRVRPSHGVAVVAKMRRADEGEQDDVRRRDATVLEVLAQVRQQRLGVAAGADATARR
jgi:hypothetical protein